MQYHIPGVVIAMLLSATLRADDLRPTAPQPDDGNPRTVYLSTGDNQDVLDFAALDSAATVEVSFYYLKK